MYMYKNVQIRICHVHACEDSQADCKGSRSERNLHNDEGSEWSDEDDGHDAQQESFHLAGGMEHLACMDLEAARNEDQDDIKGLDNRPLSLLELAQKSSGKRPYKGPGGGEDKNCVSEFMPDE